MKCQYYNVSPWMVDIHYADIFEFTGMLRMVIDTSEQVSSSGDKEAKQTEDTKRKFCFLTFSFTDPHALTAVSFTLTKTETGFSVDHGALGVAILYVGMEEKILWINLLYRLVKLLIFIMGITFLTRI